MAAGMHMTLQTRLALAALASGEAHGYQVCKATGLPSGTVYPLLARLGGRGLAVSRRDGRRRYWRLTPAGRAEQRQHPPGLTAQSPAR